MTFVLEYDPERPERGTLNAPPVQGQPLSAPTSPKETRNRGFVLEYDPERPERGTLNAPPTDDNPIFVERSNVKNMPVNDTEAFDQGYFATKRKYEASLTPSVDAFAEGLLFGGTSGDLFGGNLTGVSRLPYNMLQSYRGGEGFDIGRDFERGRSQRLGELDYLTESHPYATGFGSVIGAVPAAALGVGLLGRAAGAAPGMALPNIPGIPGLGMALNNPLIRKIGGGGLLGGGFEAGRRAVGDSFNWIFDDLIR